MDQLSSKIKEARKKAMLSQAELGERVGLTDKAISSYESGRSIPPVDKLQKISQQTHLPIAFFTGEDSAGTEVLNKLAEVEDLLKDLKTYLLTHRIK